MLAWTHDSKRQAHNLCTCGPLHVHCFIYTSNAPVHGCGGTVRGAPLLLPRLEGEAPVLVARREMTGDARRDRTGDSDDDPAPLRASPLE